MYNPWFFSGWNLNINIPATIQKRLLKFLLKKAIGQFLADELDLENLEVEFGKGLVHLRELQLNVKVLNELLTDLPIVIKNGRIGGIIATVPWKNIWSCDCQLEIYGLQLTVFPEQLKPRNAKTQPEDSHILSSSIHFAGDFLAHEIQPEEDEELRNSIYQSFHSSASYMPDNPQETSNISLDHSESLPSQHQSISQGSETGIEGVEVLARLIDKIMSNVKVVFRDTLIRMYHKSSGSPDINGLMNDGAIPKDYYFDLEIPLISYRDETSGLVGNSTSTKETFGDSSITLPAAQTEIIKSMTISGLKLWIREQKPTIPVKSNVSNLKTSSIALNSNNNPRRSRRQVPVPGDEFSEIPEIPGTPDSGDEFYDAQQSGESRPTSEAGDLPTENQESNQTPLYEAMILTCGEHDNIGRVTIKPKANPALHFDLNNASSSYMYTQEAIQQANTTQTWNFDCNIKSAVALLTPWQASLFTELITSLSQIKVGRESRSTSHTESDDDFIQDGSRVHVGPIINDNQTKKRDQRNSNQPTDVGYQATSKTHQLDDDYSYTDDFVYHSQNIPQNNNSSRSRFNTLDGSRLQGKQYNNSSANTHFSNNAGFFDLSINDREPLRSEYLAKEKLYPLRNPTYHPNRASNVPNLSSSTVSPPLSNSLPSIIPSSSSSLPVIDVNLNFSLIELFFLYENPEGFIPDQTFFETRSQILNKDHLKIEIQGIKCRLQTWELESISVGRRRSLAGSSGGAMPHGHKRNLNSEEASQFIFDIIINDLDVFEWLQGFEIISGHLSDLPQFKKYNQILSFDEGILKSYDPEETDFPTFSPENIDQSPKSNARMKSKSNTNKAPSSIDRTNSNEAINIQIKCGAQGGEAQGTLKTDSFNLSNINVSLKPINLHLDLRIIDRLSRYMNVSGSSSNFTPYKQDITKPPYTEHSAGQNIIDDLDTQRSNQIAQSQRSFTKVYCELVRVWIICPDLNTPSPDDLGNPYRIHSDILIVDIRKINVLTGGALKTSTNLSPAHSYGLQDSDEKISVDLQHNTFKIEFASTSLFLKRAKENEARCFVSIQKLKSWATFYPRSLAPITSGSPNVEVTYRPVGAVTSRLSFVGNGSHSSPFSQTFAYFEGEERVNWPMENEEEEILMFKQRTIENSLFVFNCYFPMTRVRIAKTSYDALQILLNDLALWQPKFTTPNKADLATFSLPKNSNAMSCVFDDPSQGDNSNENDSYDEDDMEMRRRMEGGFIDVREESMVPMKPSLASVVVLLANAEIGIICDHELEEIHSPQSVPRSYQLNMSELRFFTVIKHQGKDDTYVCLDNDDFTLWDISNSPEKSQILSRTISKGIKTKNTRPMISIIMLTSLEPDIDLIVKETNLTLSINGLTLRYSKNPRWPDDLLEFLQTPEMVPYVDLPNQFTKLIVVVNDSSIDLKPDDIDSRVVVVLDSLKASSTINSDSPLFKAKLISQNIDLLVVDNIKTLNERVTGRLSSSPIDVKTYWKIVGLAHAANVDFLEISLIANKGEIIPKFELALTNEKLTVETCADSFHTLLHILNHLTSNDPSLKKKVEKNPKKTVAQSSPNEDSNEDSNEAAVLEMLASIDQKAFQSPAQPVVGPNITRGVTQSTLKFVEEHYSIDSQNRGENLVSDFEHTVLFDDDLNDDFVMEQQLYTVAPSLGIRQGSEASIPATTSDGVVHTLDQDPLNFVENHFAIPTLSELEEVKEKLPESLIRIRIRDFNILWKLYDGYDWENTRVNVLNNLEQAKFQAKQSASSKQTKNESDARPLTPLDPESNSFIDHLYIGPNSRNSNYDSSSQVPSEIDYNGEDQGDLASLTSSPIESPNVHDGSRPEQLPRPRPKLIRSRSSKLDIKLEKLNLEFDLFPEGQLASRLLLLIRNIEILDNIKTSAWRKFLSHMRPENDSNPRETKSNMVRVELHSVRPIPLDPSEELRLKARLLPLRFYIDQDALNFIIRFFSFQDTSKLPTSTTQDEVYIQYCEIQPIVMKIDYKPKHIDYTSLKEGNLVELMNFFHFDGADMTLRNVKLRGVKGWQRLLEELGAAWLPHIKSTQVPNVVSGVAPIRSLVNIGSGVADLILLPIEQYKKDGRIIRGLQKGTQSFAKATTMEAIKFGTKLAVGTQILLEHADQILSFETEGQTSNSSSTSGGGSNSSNSNSKNRNVGSTSYNVSGLSRAEFAEDGDSDDDKKIKEFISKYADQPADLNEGIEEAYKSLRQNFGSAAHTIFAVPMEVYEKAGAQGSVKAVIRAVPVAALKPMIGASEAVSKALLGLRNTIDPNKKLQMEDKYKKR
ncbi:hypothetical protein G9A89_004793 [Geosiphon pyriformis]|nr:hypothetical protein G9A89_004793 [Geosiphon pyriformis]